MSTSSESGGISDTIPADWVAVAPGPGAEIVQFIKELPHDPNPLGLRAAHQRTKVPPGTFRAVRFSSVDGTPLGGMLGLSFSSDAMPRPGVVLVPGFTQTTHQKYIVELADLFQRNGSARVDGRSARARGQPYAVSRPHHGRLDGAGDVLGAVRFLRGVSPAITSVAVIGFSDGGRSLVKAMGGDGGGDIAAGVAVTAALGPTTPETPPTPGTAPTPLNDFFRTFLGTSSTYEYYDRAARSYGVDLRTMEARTVADTDVVHVKAPLLLLYALDDFFWLAKLKNGLRMVAA